MINRTSWMVPGELAENGSWEMWLETPLRNHTWVLGFESRQRALVHLVNHVLAEPECLAWALAWPEFAAHVPLDSSQARFQLLTHMRRDPAAAESLLQCYLQAAAVTLQEVAYTGWFVEHQDGLAALSVTGIYVYAREEIIRSIYIPGMGTPHSLRGILMGGNPYDEAPSLKELQPRCFPEARNSFLQRSARFEDRSPEEQLYYLVFRPVVQHVRNRHYLSCDPYGRRGGDVDFLALLKHKLPRMRQLSFATWRALRQQLNPSGRPITIAS
ncbi:MAG: hypothetical protein KatS3mg114_0224 [Planctomycetaceae bacterium]|nr:MAG: hypothetical protein KatS3mg114_0224 [Planctomycetaceae bacterium]